MAIPRSSITPRSLARLLSAPSDPFVDSEVACEAAFGSFGSFYDSEIAFGPCGICEISELFFGPCDAQDLLFHATSSVLTTQTGCVQDCLAETGDTVSNTDTRAALWGMGGNVIHRHLLNLRVRFHGFYVI